MPRQARLQTSTNVYHVILRGVNKQQIFEDDDDYKRFVSVLSHQAIPEVNPETGVARPHCHIYAYCLMGNHIHLLLQEADETIGETMKRIASSYVYYYNHKYNRIGHLFQERFKSQPVNDLEYFVTLLRYIHQNPVKGGIVKHVGDYPWSSWREYEDWADAPFCRTAVVFKRMPLGELRQLVELPLSEDQEKGLIDVDAYPGRTHYTDQEVWRLLETISGTSNTAQFQALPRPQQKHYLYEVHEQGVGPRTLSRLTGVPYAIVQRATSSRATSGMAMAGVCESTPREAEYDTYLDEGDFAEYPEY